MTDEQVSDMNNEGKAMKIDFRGMTFECDTPEEAKEWLMQFFTQSQ